MRLIDADELKLRLYNNGKSFDRINGNEHFILGVKTALDVISDMPTINPVKHAKWNTKIQTKRTDFGTISGTYPTCSVCGFFYMSGEDMKYCGNCGARMDGD